MGKHARAFFEEAERLGGLAAKAQLAALARVTSTEAATGGDTPDMLRRLQTAMTEVKNRRGAKPSPAVAADGEIVPANAGGREAMGLRAQFRCIAELMSQRSLFLGDVDKTVRRVNEAAASTLDVERVSVWALDAGRTKITCLDLFERTAAKHASGVELFRKDFEAYFAALESERTIAAGDAHQDPRTSCFSASYLKPLGIGALLDVPIWVQGTMAGVLCHEHVGPSRKWNSDEEAFAYLLSTIIALSMERR
ncbi:MAG TPA: GAF domain-containing protein [Polyangiaceae bacterium]|nr:GAF domain-containing protein [Polyangiaceae bacterium]